MRAGISIILNILYGFGFFTRLLKGSRNFIFRTRVSLKIMIVQIIFTFVEALGVSSLLALGLGAAVNVIVMPILASFSQERLIYTVLIVIVTRELGPLFTAFIISARSATAIATELAGMVISHEVEAYISVGVDPIEYLAVPRFLGVTISICLLNVYFSFFGLAGSFWAALFINPMPARVYFSSLLQVLNLRDILISLIKSAAFGVIISLAAVTAGFSVERASTEIPVAGLKAVTAAFFWCIIADILLSVLFYVTLR
jgi:phospholipid/cholesterol/gamma-HCH transport system permease protein